MSAARPILTRLVLLLLIGGPAAYAAVSLFQQSDNEKVVASGDAPVQQSRRNAQRAPAVESNLPTVQNPAPLTARERAAAAAAAADAAAGKGVQPQEVLAYVPDGQPAFDVPEGVTQKERLLAAVAEVAAVVTDADPVYLMALADKESNFVPHAESKMSSATGLYQFTDATWLETVKRVGPRYGMQHDADMIRIVNGKPVVDDPEILKEILDRRSNPTIAAVMAAEKANYDKQRIERQLGHKLNHTQTYIAHLLGTGAAIQFLKLMKESPTTKAADAFPKAAPGNAPLFYRKTADGRVAFTIAEMYSLIERMIEKRLKEYAEFHDPATLAHALPEFDLE
jgi:hypothetical protein